MTEGSSGRGPRLRVGYVPGVQPDKWLGRWRERRPDVPITARRVGDPRAGLAAAPGEGDFDVVFLREPADAPRSAPPGLLRIPLYTETMAVLATRGHELGAFDALAPEELDGERWLDPVDAIAATPEEVSAAVDLVAAGVGLLVLPLPYARSLSRRDVVARPLEGVPATRMGVAWSPAREGDALIDDFVGIVRGRTANTSRTADGSRAAGPAEPSRAQSSRAESSRAGSDAVRRSSPPRSRGQRRGGARRSRRG